MKTNNLYNFIHDFFGIKKESSLAAKRGFTLIEIMVSVSIFTIIITTGIGALVSIVNTYEVTQRQKKVHDGLNYALESMTREMRLGQNYLANAASFPNPEGSVGDSNDGSSLGFNASDGRGYVIYSLNGDGVLVVDRSGANNPAADGMSLLTDSDDLIIQDIEFVVVGTPPSSSGDMRQPLVWIRIRARAQGSTRDTVVQSLVSQRALDV